MIKSHGFWNKGLNNFLVKSSIILFIILFFVQSFFYLINKGITIPSSFIKDTIDYKDFSISYKSILPNYGKLLIRADEKLYQNISILLNGKNIFDRKSDKGEIFVKEGDLIEIISHGEFYNKKTVTLLDMKKNIKNIEKEEIILKNGLYEIFVVKLE